MRPKTGITLKEYNRLWTAVMNAYARGIFSRETAQAAIAELTAVRPVWR
jgi:hypothetical protein